MTPGERFDALLLRLAPAGVVVAAVCIVAGLVLLALVGAWSLKDLVW